MQVATATVYGRLPENCDSYPRGLGVTYGHLEVMRRGAEMVVEVFDTVVFRGDSPLVELGLEVSHFINLRNDPENIAVQEGTEPEWRPHVWYAAVRRIAPQVFETYNDVEICTAVVPVADAIDSEADRANSQNGRSDHHGNGDDPDTPLSPVTVPFLLRGLRKNRDSPLKNRDSPVAALAHVGWLVVVQRPAGGWIGGRTLGWRTPGVGPELLDEHADRGRGGGPICPNARTANLRTVGSGSFSTRTTSLGTAGRASGPMRARAATASPRILASGRSSSLTSAGTAGWPMSNTVVST